MFYLNKVDRLVKEKLRIKVYSRYMDDFVLASESKKTLKVALSEIRKVCDELKLTLNSKTQIFPLKNGFTYLGFKYKLSKDGKLLKFVSKRTIKRFKQRAKLLNKAFSDGAVSDERVCQTLTAYYGHMKHSNSFVLQRKLFKRIKVPLKNYVSAHKNLKKIFIGVKLK